MGCRKLNAFRTFFFFLAASICGPSVAQQNGAQLPQYDEDTHLGVSSCASSVCHGRAERSEESRVWLTEFRIWQGSDPHATAYSTLLTEQSSRIARNLGIGPAAEAQVCLNCHADNVSTDHRGERFQLSDGVGCEACHGGSEHWISSHTDSAVSHTENIQAGMYPTASPQPRAQLCLSCHSGTSKKFASHELMAGGHPQLLFENATFALYQPMHFQIDEDYEARKGEYNAADLWLNGLVEAAENKLDLAGSAVSTMSAELPDTALFHCDSCHRLTNIASGGGLPVDQRRPGGSIPINDTALALVSLVSTALELPGATALSAELDKMVLTASVEPQKLADAASDVAASLHTVSGELVRAPLSSAQLSKLRRALIRFAAEGRARYFADAFHVFLSVNVLNETLQDGLISNKDMSLWFESVVSESTFDRAGFAARASQLSSL